MTKKVRNITLGCVGAFVALMVLGCGGTGSSETASVISSSTSSATKAASSKSAASKVDQVFNVGQTVKVENCEMTVTKVDKSAGGEFEVPQKPSDEFVIVNVKIKNDGTDNLSYNSLYFKMQNSQGQITGTTITTIDQSTALNSGELVAGGSVSGTIVFQEPKNDKGLILQYQDNYFASGNKLQFKCS